MPGLPSGFARSLVNKTSKAQRILVADQKTTGKVGDDGVQVSIGNLPGLQPFGAGIGKQFLIFKMWESDVVTFADFVVKTILVWYTMLQCMQSCCILFVLEIWGSGWSWYGWQSGLKTSSSGGLAEGYRSAKMVASGKRHQETLCVSAWMTLSRRIKELPCCIA